MDRDETAFASPAVADAVPSPGMTIREYIKRRMWTWLALAIGCWLLIALTAVIAKGAHYGPAVFLPLVGFAGFASAIVGLTFFVKCPKCKARLAQTIGMYVAFQWGGRRQVNFCPFCGVNLDEPVPGSELRSPQDPIHPA
jgi:hypothetical protein